VDSPTSPRMSERESTLFTRHEYMTKQGAVFKTWRRRYFSLNPEALQIAYYKSAGDHLEKKKPKGVINLENASARRIEVEGKSYLLEVFYPKEPHRRSFKIVASTEHAANSWVSTINEIIRTTDQYDGSDAITTEGELLEIKQKQKQKQNAGEDDDDDDEDDGYVYE